MKIISKCSVTTKKRRSLPRSRDNYRETFRGLFSRRPRSLSPPIRFHEMARPVDFRVERIPGTFEGRLTLSLVSCLACGLLIGRGNGTSGQASVRVPIRADMATAVATRCRAFQNSLMHRQNCREPRDTWRGYGTRYISNFFFYFYFFLSLLLKFPFISYYYYFLSNLDHHTYVYTRTPRYRIELHTLNHSSAHSYALSIIVGNMISFCRVSIRVGSNRSIS